MFGWHSRMGGFCGYGPGMGYGFRRGPWFGWPFTGASELDWLKRYRDGLELHKKDLEAEIKAVEERIQELENRTQQ